MGTVRRLLGLKNWIQKELCDGRIMKAMAPNGNIGVIERQEPRCYIGWAPTRRDVSGLLPQDPSTVAPGIIIMPTAAYAKYTEEKRFDRYSGIQRPKAMGQHLSVDILFAVYEPGVRQPGFIDSVGENGKGLDMTLIKEGTEEGLTTLLNWMDECMEGLLEVQTIPNTDLLIEEESMIYDVYRDQNYVVDRRPMYYGFVKATFMCYAESGLNRDINDLLL
jgi:hypothetical protein